MDPNAALREMLYLANKISSTSYKKPCSEDAYRLADLTRSLNLWIVTGGFLPANWVGGPNLRVVETKAEG